MTCSSSPLWKPTSKATSSWTTGIVCSPEPSTLVKLIYASTLLITTNTCTLILLHRQRKSLTPFSTRTVSADRTRLAKPTSSSRAFLGISPFFCRMESRSGETNYRYECMDRVVHPVSTPRCYIKLLVVLRLPQHLAMNTVLNFSSSTTYFLDPDSRLLSPIASEVPCSALFPAVYQTHQGWISVTPETHQAPPPKLLPITPPCRTEDVFRTQDYNTGGLYQPSTLDAMQDFLLTLLLCEAVTYKLAHQVHNLRPENDHVLGPLDLFLDSIAATADWRNLLFGGWWSWLEKWGKVVSIFIGLYYLYVIG